VSGVAWPVGRRRVEDGEVRSCVIVSAGAAYDSVAVALVLVAGKHFTLRSLSFLQFMRSPSIGEC